MKLTQQQQQVLCKIKEFMESDASVFILCGYAGTGKTTMVKQIADYLSQTREVRLMAPTGRAARVLAKKTGYVATTIHKAIYSSAGIVAKKVTKGATNAEIIQIMAAVTIVTTDAFPEIATQPTDSP